jgi:N-acyl-D-amino-acid deacylase
MTGMTAQRFGLKDRGLLREGFAADLVLFDADLLADRADYGGPCLPPGCRPCGSTANWR